MELCSKDCLTQVVSYLPFLDIVHLAQVSKYFRDLTDSPVVWKQFFQIRNITFPTSSGYNYDICIQFWKKVTLYRVMGETLIADSEIQLRYLCSDGKKWGENIINLNECQCIDVKGIDINTGQLMVNFQPLIDTETSIITLKGYEHWLRSRINVAVILSRTRNLPCSMPEQVEFILNLVNPSNPPYSHSHFNLLPINLDTFWSILDTPKNSIEEIMNNLEKKILSDEPYYGVNCIHQLSEIRAHSFSFTTCPRQECYDTDFRTEWKDMKTHICNLFRTMLNT